MKVDRGSETWASVVAWSKNERDRANEALVDRRTSYEDTQFFRGVLDVLRRLDEIDRLDAPITTDKAVDY